MSRRIPYRVVRHVQPYANRCPHTRVLFSTSSRSAQQPDPATALVDTLKPANTPRPPQTPLPSRSPSDLTDGADNPFLGKVTTGPGNEPEKAGVEDSDRGGARRLLNSMSSDFKASEWAEMDKHRNKQTAIRKMEAQITRQWEEGDVYSPHDLSSTEMVKNLSAKSSRIMLDNYAGNTSSMKMKDTLDELNINPLNEYKNFAMMSEFVTETGKIKHRRETGYRAPNQRKMAKAVRRAVGIGILPSVHKHPELFVERRRQMEIGDYDR